MQNICLNIFAQKYSPNLFCSKIFGQIVYKIISPEDKSDRQKGYLNCSPNKFRQKNLGEYNIIAK
jgi:hypothetical protein